MNRGPHSSTIPSHKDTRLAVRAMKGAPATPLQLTDLRTVAQQMGLPPMVQGVNRPEALVGALAAMQYADAEVLNVQQTLSAILCGLPRRLKARGAPR